MGLLEAEVHASLRSFLRVQNYPFWSHHLTMARLISRAIRLKRSALIQTGSTMHRYWVSYLIPALLSQESIVLVVPAAQHPRLLNEEIAHLQRWLESYNPVQIVDRLSPELRLGLTIISPENWLRDRLNPNRAFAQSVPTLIDSADELEAWTKEILSVALTASDWETAKSHYPQQLDLIRNLRINLTKAIFSHPRNPYECYRLDAEELYPLRRWLKILAQESRLISPFREFWQRWQSDNQILWATVERETGQFTLQISPVEVASVLQPIWEEAPVVFMGGFLDAEKSAPTYRQQMGLGEMLCLQFSPTRQSENIQLYLPDRLPLPNTPEFRGLMMDQIFSLMAIANPNPKPIAILVDDVPLKAQIGVNLAAELGSKVQVEKPISDRGGILVCGWDYWHRHNQQMATPQLLIMVTLPLPSLEDPLVAGRVAYFKRQHKDWFRLYLLPTALLALQQAVMPLRESQALVAVLDSRVNSRSYGHRVLNALEPYAKVNYLDKSWLAKRLGEA
jgi:ATP-dependent DNA helicase DinG